MLINGEKCGTITRGIVMPKFFTKTLLKKRQISFQQERSTK